MEFATRAIHAGQEQDPATGAVTPPIHMTSIYAFAEPGVTVSGYEYIRYGNPTRHAWEVCLASLENAPEDCPALAYSSGQAATDGVFRLLKPGERLLLARDLYGRHNSGLRKNFTRRWELKSRRRTPPITPLSPPR